MEKELFKNWSLKTNLIIMRSGCFTIVDLQNTEVDHSLRIIMLDEIILIRRLRIYISLK